jgi:hypothetical protein
MVPGDYVAYQLAKPGRFLIASPLRHAIFIREFSVLVLVLSLSPEPDNPPLFRFLTVSFAFAHTIQRSLTGV